MRGRFLLILALSVSACATGSDGEGNLPIDGHPADVRLPDAKPVDAPIML